MTDFLFYIPAFRAGGAERVASVLINQWANCKDRYQVTVVNTVSGEPDFFEIDSSLERIVLPYDYNKSGLRAVVEVIRRIFVLRSFLKSRQENLIVSFVSKPSLLVLLASIGLKKKVICCEHTNYYAVGNVCVRFARDFLYYFLAEKVTVLTERDLLNYPKILRKKLVVMPNPIGVDGFEVEVSYPSAAPKLKPVQLLFVGRLVEAKGIPRLCEILKGISGLNWELNICGDGNLKAKLEAFVKDNNLSDKVTFHGTVSNIESYYMRADLLVMTSYWEGLPMVIAEAMSFGVPVIAFDCPTGPREFIENGVNGILVDDGDIDEYVDQISSLIGCRSKLLELSNNTKHSVYPYRVEAILESWKKLFDLCG